MASQSIPQTSPSTGSIRWSESETQQIVNWLSLRDENGNFINLDGFRKGDWSGAGRRLLDDNENLKKKPGMTVTKARDKLRNMSNLYKKWHDIAEKTGWHVDRADHGSTVDGSNDPETVRGVLRSKCSFYYDLEMIMGDDGQKKEETDDLDASADEGGGPDRADESASDDGYESANDTRKKKETLDASEDEGVGPESADETASDVDHESIAFRQRTSSEADRRSCSTSQLPVTSAGDDGASTPARNDTPASARNNKVITPIRKNALLPGSGEKGSAPVRGDSSQPDSDDETSTSIRDNSSTALKKRKSHKKRNRSVEMDSESDNKTSKTRAKKSKKGKHLSIAEAILESSKMDAEMKQWQFERSERENARRHERAERENAHRHELLMEQAKETNLRLQIQLQLLRQGGRLDHNALG